MPANGPLYAKSERRLRFVPKTDDLKIAVKDRMYLPQLETCTRAEIKQSRNVWRYEHAGAKAERGSVCRQMKSVCDRSRRKEIGRTWVKTSLAVRINMQCGRKEQVNPLADTRRQHRLQVICIF